MAKFTIRIELHDARAEDYSRLHDSMNEQGFQREIVSGDGARYQMPPADYVFEGEVTLNQVLAKAKTGAAASNRKFSALVTESKGRVWFNLAKVT